MIEEKFNFTKAYKEIEEINTWFQQEDINLDEALEKYERGMELIKNVKID
jgi:exodeoxyribonuclease VII small subunit